MHGERVIVAYVKTNVHDHHEYLIKLEILEELVRSLGGKVVCRMVQVRKKPRVDYVFGKGKIGELKNKVSEIKATSIVFYNTLSSKQRWNLERSLRVEVLDRYDVTLKVFREASQDVLSKLQIEMAALKKMFPYVKLQASIKYKRMRAGFKGGGEYAYHKQVNAIQRRIKILREKIEKCRIKKIEEIRKKKKLGGKIIALVGHYNAGKTSLFNRLTGLNKPVSPSPFTTLSSKYASLLDENTYLVDTIGFVVDQDPRLITSFEINLIDIMNADLVFFVMDASDRNKVFDLKLKEVTNILMDIGVNSEKLIPVLNKADLVDEKELVEKRNKVVDRGYSSPVVVSALTGYGTAELLSAVKSRLKRRLILEV